MSKKIKNVCIYGIGGVGGYFGGKIAHKINKNNRAIQVYFIGRGEHLKAVQQNGLYLFTDNKEFVCYPSIATDDIEQIPIPDLYLLCVKGYDLDNAVISISKNIHIDTIVVPLLNGIDIYERIRKYIQNSIIIPACVYVSSSIEKLGVIRQKGSDGHIIFGKDPLNLDYNYDYLVEFFKEMKISYAWHDNPYKAIWEKYVFITALSLMTAYSKKTLGEVLFNEQLRSMTENIMKEVVLVGKIKNIVFEQNIVEKTLKKAKSFPYETKTSFQRDYEKGNNRHEGDIFGGTLIRLAKEYNVRIPTIAEVYGALMKR